MGLTTAVDNLTTLTASLTGIRQAPSAPPEQATAFPFAVVYPSSGTASGGPLGGIFRDATHGIVAEIHTARKYLPKDIAAIQGYYDLFITALQADPTLGGAVKLTTQLDYQFGGLGWGGVDTIGWRFTVTVRTNEC